MVVPWRPPLGREVVARVRVVGSTGRGELAASWDDEPAVVVGVAGGSWHDVALPRPPGIVRGRLHLAWHAAAGASLIVDRVEAR